MVLSTLELAQLRADQADYQPDTCIIQTVARTSDSQGGYTELWSNTHQDVVCRLSPERSDRGEEMEGEQPEPLSSWVLTLAYNQTIDERMRVIHGGEVYQVLRLDDTHSNRTAKRAYLRRTVLPDYAGWWDNYGTVLGCIGAWQPKGAASLVASYQDLSAADNDLTVGATPTWAAATGWTFDGVYDYLKTGITVASTYTMIVRYSMTIAGNGRAVMGSKTTANNAFYMQPESAYAGYAAAFWGSGYNYQTSTPASGVLALASNKFYRDGSLLGTTSGAWSDTNTQEVYIGAYNNNGSAALFYDGTVVAAAMYNRQLAAGEILAISELMADI